MQLMRSRCLIVLAGMGLSCLFCLNTKAEESIQGRIALVIGNLAYPEPLRTPLNDAADIADVFLKMGFQVNLLKNAGQEEMFQAIRVFGEELKSDGVGVFYYAGRGMQWQGVNYLLPVNADIRGEDEIPYRAIDVGLIFSKLKNVGNPLNLVLLDACYALADMPGGPAIKPGLAPVKDLPEGVVLVYAANHDANVSEEKTGRNGVFAKHLLKQFGAPGIELGEMLQRVKTGVEQESRGQQIPWLSSAFSGSFYPAGSGDLSAQPDEVPAFPGSVEGQGEMRDCQDYSKDINDYSFCRFSKFTRFANWIDPDGFNFKNASGIPEWIQQGLDQQGVYSKKTLINAIKNGFKHLQEANLKEADLRGMNFAGVDLQNANLQKANLKGAKLKDANVKWTDFTNAIWIDGKQCKVGSIGRCKQ